MLTGRTLGLFTFNWKLKAAECETKRFLSISLRRLQFRWGHVFNPWSVTMLFWNVTLYRKLGHMVYTTGNRMKGDGSIFQVHPCSTAQREHSYHDVSNWYHLSKHRLWAFYWSSQCTQPRQLVQTAACLHLSWFICTILLFMTISYWCNYEYFKMF